ncbi:MAG: asparagine synthase (glutamine-hydrolyzing) [Acidobacteria bacterium RIFCSPLOWO2_02_FULL_67_36]|nr:MAG: asparagine synthase (glutamine-hydrolyzing) [Acidobacteria bacterium RIFCSPLOWO2_02_FULL_67_36]OFW23134.1 MAG: asparagine synthase (glutamine-hydrolyzing) [Acidobacteria bacterium RIFCSPLOWO2_12_FULL_66_21]
MCGIVGVCNLNGEPVAEGLLRRMTNAIAHRGPDGEGHYTDGQVGLGHRRLAIIDLTTAAHQPMANETGKVLLTYNGEIYNFQKLRVELEALGHRFHSSTDSEVVVHGWEEWGEECLLRFNGMFAFAIWDRTQRRLFLARDRYGVKPLYWYLRDGLFLFGSEIKALLVHPRVSVNVCRLTLDEYFTFQNVFTDRTLFEGIRLLPAGCSLTLDLMKGGDATVRRYWDFPVPDEGLDVDDEEAGRRIHHLFQEAVTRQLVSDVPIGGYLSGGMDSGSIVAVAVRHLPRLMTFTGGFDLTSASGLELGFDERRNAEMLANLFKTEHYEVVLHAGDMEHVLPKLTWHLEDLRVGQCYPNYYVARLASKFVKVVLSGAGGDELFAGYPWRYYQGLDSASPEAYLERYYSYWQRLVPDDDKRRLFNTDTQRAISGHSSFDVFRSVFEAWLAPLRGNADYLAVSLYFELKTFLHGVLMVEDKLSMAHSLETRVPFLDNDLVDYAMRIPVRHKLGDLESGVTIDENLPGKRRLYEQRTNDGKAILRRAMLPLIPREVTERAKQGFSAPDASWFRGESIDYINRLLRDRKARLYEFIQPAYVERVLDEHCSGRVNRRLLIWSFLSFEWWCRTFLTGEFDGRSAFAADGAVLHTGRV